MSNSTQKTKPNPQHVSGRAQRRIEEEKNAKRQKYMIFGGAAALALIVAIVLIVVSMGGDDDTPEENALLPQVVAAAPLDASLVRDGRTLGDANAPVTLTIWGDYQCPFCGAFSKQILPDVIRDFVSTGQVRVEYKEMAFLDGRTGYGESDMAAEAVTCAIDQNKYWEMHETIYANQYGENEGAYSKARLKEMAAAAGLDAEQFNDCFDDRKYEDAVKSLEQEGVDLGVDSTPTLFLNGTEVAYTGKYEDLKAEIERVLAG